MLILPSSNPARARRLLDRIAEDGSRCSIIVFGNTEQAREIASRADMRAEGHPFRKVVWIPEPAVLEGVPRFAHLRAAAEQGYDAVAMTVRFQVAARLRGPDALNSTLLERAFAGALAGEGER